MMKTFCGDDNFRQVSDIQSNNKKRKRRPSGVVLQAARQREKCRLARLEIKRIIDEQGHIEYEVIVAMFDYLTRKSAQKMVSRISKEMGLDWKKTDGVKIGQIKQN